MSSMPHENGCKCIECCYPQRPAVKKSDFKSPEVQSGRGPAAAKKQGSAHN